MPKSKPTQQWEPGDIFTVRQRDGICSLGQVIESLMVNIVSCAFYDIRVPCSQARGPFKLAPNSLIALLSVTREQLDFGKWKVVAKDAVNIAADLWPNEEFRKNQWVGVKIYDASIAEELLDAYNGLVPWDDWHDPAYLDKLLVSPERKPKHILRKKA